MYNVSSPHIKSTFQALVDAIIPMTPNLAIKLGPEHVPGAVNLAIDEYVIWELDNSLAIQMGLSMTAIPLSAPVAAMLDAAAVHCIRTGIAQPVRDTGLFAGGGPFTALSPRNRFRAMSSLEQLEVDLGSLPAPYTYNAPQVLFTVDFLHRLTMFGYYSEWSGYGKTRLNTPENRKLEYFPLSWIQTDYPGPAFGYRDFRGFVLKYAQVERNQR